MKCQEVSEWMQRYLDRDLDDSSDRAMTDHLEQCPACAALFERLKRISAELESLPKVTPSISLVDSILPRLEQIDRLDEAEGLRKAAAEKPVISWMTRWKQQFPFKSVGGVIAAGIVLGLVIVNSNMFSPSPSKVADEHARSSEAMPESTAILESTNDTQALTLEEREDAVEPVADPDASMTMEFTDEPSAGMGMISEGDSALDTGRSQGILEETEPAADSDAPVAMEFTEEPTAKIGVMSEGDTAMESSESQGFAGTADAPKAAASMANTELPSPDGSLVAIMELNRVVVLNSDGERIFVSESKEADRITLLLWSEDGNTVEYEVTVGDAVSKFRINVAERTETAL